MGLKMEPGVGAEEGAVKERAVDVLREGGEGGLRDAAGEGVGIVVREAGHGADVSGEGIDDDHGAAVLGVFQGAFGDALGFEIEGGDDIAPGGGRGEDLLIDDATSICHHEAEGAIGAGELFIERGLEAGGALRALPEGFIAEDGAGGRCAV